MIDIKTIPTDELEKDLEDSYKDIITCEAALSLGIELYSCGRVKERLEANRGFVEVITAELKRRNGINVTYPLRED